jgi:hypothetical protein
LVNIERKLLLFVSIKIYNQFKELAKRKQLYADQFSHVECGTTIARKSSGMANARRRKVIT